MEPRVSTYRARLVACFLICMSIPTALGLLIYRDLGERRTLEQGVAQLDIGLARFQQAVQHVHDFFTFGERDVRFFETGESAALEDYQKTIAATREALDAFRTDAQARAFLTALDDYERKLAHVAEMLRARGFENHGLVGAMRSTIHELESRVVEPGLLVHMLMLRRHEKDYIIRNQPKYVEQLTERARVFRQAIADSGLPDAEKAALSALVERYASQFRAVVEADRAIGIRSGSGMFEAIVRTESELGLLYRHLQTRYTANMLVVSNRMTDRLFISIVVMSMLAIAIALALSNAMTKPLRSLSTKIQHFVEADFAETMRLDDISRKRDEVGQIARSFDVLQDAMQRHLASLQAQRDTLHEQRSRLATAQQMARLGYWRWDTRFNVIETSEEVAGVFGAKPKPGEDPYTFFSSRLIEEDRARFETDVAACASEHTPSDGDFRLCANSETWIRQHLSAEVCEDGHVVVIGTVQDISDQRAAEEQIRKLAYFDNLTGVATRAYLNQRLQQMISSAKRREEGFALFFIDLDKFKEVNDSLGHDAGDALLVEVANRLRATARESDFVARLGGDEFCMLLENISSEVDIATVATRCLKNLVQPMIVAGREITPAASIGIARFPEDGTDATTLMQAGDHAMYAAKSAGFHCFEFHNHQMSAEAASRLALSQEVRKAVRDKEFVLFYQPQVSLETGEIHAWEALIRWQHPEKGLLPPAAFIDEVERLSLINEVGNWVIDQACAQISRWEQHSGLTGMCVSVNIAPKHLTDLSLLQTVEKSITTWGIRPAQLEIEVTETGIQSSPEACEMLCDLKALGVKIAIDDFGTGYSSLGSLKHLPVDCLKIDRAFVKDVANSPEDAILLRTIMSLGHNFEFRIVAEGVEDVEQIRILKALDCELLQGFFFSKPVPPEEVPQLALTSFVDEMEITPRGHKLTA